MNIKALVLAPFILLSACSDSDDKIVGPEDYVHFSETFKMDDQVSTDMIMDGGTPTVDPAQANPTAAILTADALPGDKVGEILTSTPDNSPAVNLP